MTLAAYNYEISVILNHTEHLMHVQVPQNQSGYRGSRGEAAVDTLPAEKISYIPHLRIFLKGTASLVSSIGLTIISLIAKLVNKDEYEGWFFREREELKVMFTLLGHVGMMCIRPEAARPKLQELYESIRIGGYDF